MSFRRGRVAGLWALAAGLACATPALAAVAPPPAASPAAAPVAVTPSAAPVSAPRAARDTRPRILIVIAPVAFHEGEYETIRGVLAQNRARLIVASTQAGPARGIGGHAVAVETTLDAVRPGSIAAAVIVGGPGAKTYLWFDPKLKSLLQQLNRRRRPLGALSIAVGALVNAGVLDGRQATSLPAPELQKLFERHRVTNTGKEVVVDGNVVTGSSTFAAADLAVALGRLVPAPAKPPRPARPRRTAPKPRPANTK